MGSSGGGSAQHIPQEAADSLRSRATARMLDIISEGPIGGLVAGLRSVKVNDVPVVSPVKDAAGHFLENIAGITVVERKGTQDQDAIEGFYAVEQEMAVNSGEIKGGVPGDGSRPQVPFILTITDTDIDKIRLTLGFPNMTSSSNEGDLNGTSVRIQFEISKDNQATWKLLTGNGIDADGVLTVTGKCTSRYQKSLVIDVKSWGAGPRWDIRITKLTSDPTDSKLRNSVFLDSWTRIIDMKLRYPNTALIGTQVDATYYSSVPSRSFEVFGMLVKTPNNYTPPVYDATNRQWTSYATYNGPFTGDMSTAPVQWSDNPAWCFYDMVTNDRYGLGGYVNVEDIDVFTLYDIGRYCDELVPSGFKDGSGNDILEPRFRCNLNLTSQEEAYKVLLDMASIFRGMIYWNVGQIYAVQDKPSDPVYLFTKSNVSDESGFQYTSTGRRQRTNCVMVAWNDPNDNYRQKIEYVEHAESIAKYGRLIQKEILAIGCTSQGQAHRAGRWLLYTENFETEAVQFSAGLEGIMIRPGDVIHVSDADRLSVRMGGRFLSSDGMTHVLDSAPDLSLLGECWLEASLPDGTIQSRKIQTAVGDTIVTDPFPVENPDKVPAYMAQWVISSASLVPQTYRIVSIIEKGTDRYDITALEHNPSKFDYIERGLALDNPPDGGSGSPNPNGGDITPHNLVLGEYLKPKNGDFDTILTATWDRVLAAKSFVVEWKRKDGNWTQLPEVTGTHAEIPDIIPDGYYVRVASKLANGTISKFTMGFRQVLGKTAPPANVANFIGTSTVNDVELKWDAIPDLDFDHYVIKIPGAGATDAIKWTAGTVLFDQLKSTKVLWQRQAPGSWSLMIKAVDTSGNESLAPTNCTVPVNPEDDYLTPTEKRQGKRDYDVIWKAKVGLDNAATAANITTEKTTYDTAVTALNTHLLSIQDANPTAYAWAGPSGDATHQDNSCVGDWTTTSYTKITYLGAGGGLTYMNKFKDVWAAEDALRLAIANAGLDPGTPQETFRPKLFWDFGSSGNPTGFTASGFTSDALVDTTAEDYPTCRRWAGLSAGSVGMFGYITDPLGLFNIKGNEGYIVMARVRLNSGTWRGRCHFSTTNNSFPGYYKDIAAPKVGVWTIVAWDLRNMTYPASGAHHNIANESSVQMYLLELGLVSANVDVDWVAVGTYGAGSRLDYDLALQDAITDLLGRADTTVQGNTVITNSTNMIPNPTSESAAYPANSFGLVGRTAGNANTGSYCRSTTSNLQLTPKFAVTPGDSYYLSGYLKSFSGFTYLEAVFSDGTYQGVNTNSGSYTKCSGFVTVPAGATDMYYRLRGLGAYADDLVARKAADAFLLVNGAIEAYFARITGIQTSSLAVGPLLQFKSYSSNPLLLQQRPDGGMSRITAADRLANPSLPQSGGENPNDPNVYMDDTRLYPGSEAMTYEARFGATTEDRGFVINMGGAFGVTGYAGLLIRWSGAQIQVLAVDGIGSYFGGTTLATAVVPSTSTVDDRLSVIYFKDPVPDHLGRTGLYAVRMKVLINGSSVLEVTDVQLDKSASPTFSYRNFGGQRGGYAGVYLNGNVRIYDPRMGRGYVTVQDGAITADKLAALLILANKIQVGYAENGSGFATAGVQLDGTPGATPLKLGPGGARIGPQGLLLDEIFMRVFNLFESNGLNTSSFQGWYKGNNDALVRGGAPNINCLQTMNLNSHYDGTPNINWTSWNFKLQGTANPIPGSVNDNLDSLTFMEVEVYRNGYYTTPYQMLYVSLPNRTYRNPADATDPVNTVYGSLQVILRDAGIQDSGASDYHFSGYLRIRLHNLYGPSAWAWYGPANRNTWNTANAFGDPSGGMNPPGGGGGSGPRGGGCVSRETLIRTPGGYTQAQDLRVGSTVWTLAGWKPVLAHEIVEDQPCLRMFTDQGSLVCSKNHRVMLATGLWTEVCNLQVGDVLFGMIQVLAVQETPSVPVVKMTVADCHHYFSNGILSHNIKTLT